MRSVLRNRNIATFAIAQFLLEVQFWFPIWLIYLLDIGFPLTTAVLADGVFRIVSVACEFPVGLIADRIGRRRTYLTLAAGSVVLFAAITQIGSSGALFAVWCVWGVLWALASGAASTYLYELCAQNEPAIDPIRAFGVIRAVGSAAVLVSLSTAGWLYDIDPRVPFAVTSVLAAMTFLLARTLPEITGSRRSATVSSVAHDLRDALHHSGVRIAIWVGALLLLFGWSAQILFQPLAIHLDFSLEVTSYMYTMFAAASLVGGLAAGFVTPRRRRIATAAAFLLVLAALLATSRETAFGPFLFLVLLGFGYALGTTVLEVFTNEVTPPGLRATTFGLVACLGGIGIAAARPWLGILSKDHSVSFAFAAWAGCGAICIALAAPAIARMRDTGADVEVSEESVDLSISGVVDRHPRP